MAKAPPAFQFYVGDFLMGTAHLDAEAIGCYLLLLCFQWAHGFVPSDALKRARICRKSIADFTPIWEELLDKFVENQDGTYSNKRLEVVRANQLALSEKRARAGAKGGRSKAKAKLEQNASLQPSTFSLQTSPPTPQGELEGEVCELLRERGVKYPERAVSTAQNNGCTNSHILKAIEHFDAHRGAWDAGALYERVRTLHPNQEPTDLWPLESEGYRNQASRNRREKELQDAESKRKATKAELDAQRAREREKESTWAPIVNALSRTEAEKMLRAEIPEMATALIRNWKRGEPPSGLVRDELISILEREETKSDCLST